MDNKAFRSYSCVQTIAVKPNRSFFSGAKMFFLGRLFSTIMIYEEIEEDSDMQEQICHRRNVEKKTLISGADK